MTEAEPGLGDAVDPLLVIAVCRDAPARRSTEASADIATPPASTRSIEELMEALKRSVEEAKAREGHEASPRRGTG